MKVKRTSNRLYKLCIQETKGACLLNKTEEEAWLWHTRFGHVNFPAIQLMQKNQMVHGLPNLIQPKEICSGCLLSKQARKPFPSQSNFTAKIALELIHGDLCGPISPVTPAGNKYFMLLVDDYTRMMWVYMIKTKDEALSVFKRFKAMVEKDGTKQGIQVFRTDRGGEFCSNEFNKFCADTGILRHYTAPYSPQQNGVVERRNRTVVAMGRSMLKERKVLPQMWGEAIRHAVYVLNRLPTRSLSGMTPYEAWFGKKPYVDYLRVFGCIAHMKIPSVHVRKLDDRSKQVVHFGREPGTKAYRLYDPSTGTVHVSRDIVFEEAKGWSWNDAKTENVASGNFTIVGHADETQRDGGSSENTVISAGETMESTPQSQRISNGSGSNLNMVTPQSMESVMHNTEESEESRSEMSSNKNEERRFRRLSDIYDHTEEIELAEELLLLGIDEPVVYEQAVKSKVWKVAMQSEIDSIEKNKTWVLTDLPKGHKAIDLKWVFKIKKDTSGEIIKHKARIVAKGYVQKHGIDYEEVFAPVTRLETVRLLLALAAKNDWEVHHLDVKSAFLNGELQEEVYVSQPKGYEKEGQESKVYRLLKALYGLRQAPRAWYAQLNKCLQKLGFIKCPFEHAVYTRRDGDESLIIGVYVDDLLITGTSVSAIIKFKEQMSKEFDMSDLGKLSYYLGLEVDQGKGYIELKQAAYAKKLLEKAGMSDCNPVKYPMDHKLQLSKDESGEPVNSTQFKSMIGGLRYLVHTRPDIAYAVGVISRFMERPTMLHLNAAKRVLRYVKGTLNFGLVYKEGRGNYLLSGFSDSDLAGNIDDRKSTGGMAFYLDDRLITWISQKQRCVALSSCEAEFMAATAAACQGIWLQRVLSQISDMKAGPVILYIDNRSAIDLAKNPVFHGRSKHIDVRYHFIRECVEQGLIVIKHVSTNEQKADILTKALSAIKFEKMRNLLGVRELR
ncbi:Retrovirus-related Pol polyprotein from transposon TNT 1-94 [Euphorbia peplus]|nr:Retrovirus-related Pol polyprotein from transposon TNT 1-94 [Euphorbia peplus]